LRSRSRGVRRSPHVLVGLASSALALTALRTPAPLRASAMRCGAVRMISVLVPIADDSEEIETACITDTLVRAGADVTVASVMPEGRLQCKMSRGLKVVADTSIDEVSGKTFDAIALPGGMPGAEHLRDCTTLTTMLKEHAGAGRTTAAVCASPAVVFATHGLLKDSATCYPAPQFKEAVGAGWTESQAVVDGNVVTSQGPGTSLQFALKLVEILFSKEKAKEIADQMLTKMAVERVGF
jgi:4-methyl-5(b-hydroxyethyl)-thiazole monophosphate biosynthesis